MPGPRIAHVGWPRPRSVIAASLIGLAVVGCSSSAAPSSGTSAPTAPSAVPTAAPSAAQSAAPSSAGQAGAGLTTVHVQVTDQGCTPDLAAIPAGPVTFVLADTSDLVLEFEVRQGDRTLGEKEGLKKGSNATLTVDLPAGDYTLECPGATTLKTAFSATGGSAQASAGASAGSGSVAALLKQGTDGYADYVRDEVDKLLVATTAFTDAVKAGDVAKAKALYGPARVYYERIEPVAESFGDLDPEIDGRIDDAATPADFTGFHRLEQALWVDGSTKDMAPIADKLVVDVTNLRDLVATETYQAADLANGASELLDEVAASKITGEEERYSRIDLLDFQANLDGAKAAYQLLQPALQVRDAELATTIDGAFTDVQTALDGYRSGDGFVAYDKLTAADTKTLAQKVAALAEPLSEVAAKVVGQ